MPNHAEQLAQELNLNVKNVQGAIELIDQGNTIPFIARYRKEATGSMDDQVLRDLGDRLEYLRGLDKRKDEVTSSITEQGAMTPELTAALSKAKTLAEVEDIYRPYKPKRKTRASIAKARGLQPLATAIFRQDAAFDPERAAADYLNDEVPDAAAALAGAQDIIAEAVSDDAACRAELRRYYRAFGRVASAKAKDEDSVYAQYYDYAEPLNKIPGHRVLALDRGEREGFLKVTIQVDAERAAGIVSWMFARKKTGGKSAELVDAAARDAYSRLIHPSLENELRGELSDAAAEGAIKVFGDNLRQLLLQPPIRGKTVMGLDPGYRRLFVDYLRDYARSENKTVFLTSHIIQDMERLVDDCIIMDYGRILIQQPVKELLDTIRRYTCTLPEGYKMPEDKDFYHPSLIRNTLETFSFLPQQEVETRFRALQMPYSDLKCETVNLEDAFIGLTGKY